MKRDSIISIETLDEVLKMGEDDLQKLIDDELEEFSSYVVFDTRPEEIKPVGIIKVKKGEDPVEDAVKKSRIKKESLIALNINTLVPILFSMVNGNLKSYRTGSVIQSVGLIKMTEHFVSEFYSYLNRSGNTGYRSTIGEAKLNSFIKTRNTH